MTLVDPRPVGVPNRLQLTFLADPLVPASGSFLLWGPNDLAGAAAEIGLPAGEPDTLRTVRPEGDSFIPIDLVARRAPLIPVARTLATLPVGSDWPAWSRPSDAVLAWSLAAKLAFERVADGHLVPTARGGHRAGTAVAAWRASVAGDPRIGRLAEAFPVSAHAVRALEDDRTLLTADEVLRSFLDAIADACARAGRRPAADVRPTDDRRLWSEAWPAALSSERPIIGELGDNANEIVAEVEQWSARALGTERRSSARLALRLAAPPPRDLEADESEAPRRLEARPWHLHYELEAAHDGSATVSAAEVWAQPTGLLELGGRRVDDAHETIIRGLAEAATVIPEVDRSLDEACPIGVDISLDRVSDLLGEGRAELESTGVALRLPPDLDVAGHQRLRARMRLGSGQVSEVGKVDATTFDRGMLTDFRYEIAIGDDVLTPEEFRQLVALKSPLVEWRGQWVRVDLNEVERLEELFGETGSMGLAEALAAALAERTEVADLGFVETVAEGELAKFIADLRDAKRPEEPTLVDVQADVRPYQKRGIAWMQGLSALGLGAVLADDMGTGKTLGAIGLLSGRAQDRPHLVVCPTSVVGNWERELNRFTPERPVNRHHGPERAEDAFAFTPGSVTVTSYALLRRDIDLLAQVQWDCVIFDEAQQIKNTASKGARAARELDARTRIALTGTPIENRLAELWAIIDVTNPGLLGSLRNFTRHYAVPIERWHDQDAANRLKGMVAPFILRRLKTDPEVALDLPPKTVVDVICSLTREQASLYQAVLDKTFSGDGLTGDAITRRGRILALLTALKQVCNHPAHYLSEAGPLTGRSGKLDRMTEIVSELTDAGDRALIFTQYRKMGDLLVNHLHDEVKLRDVPFLHGGVTLPDRDEMVRRFQEDDDAPPVMIVSLRAGGTGLNLTRASHVIHFDRWWNPAVEDQATDRVHRIGQTQAVTVHNLVTAGSVEERIIEVLERKKGLAEAVVGTGETWITELNDDELRALVELSFEDVEDEVA